MNNRSEGIEGENMACDYMRSHGLEIVERNYSCALGEVDIVAKDGEYLVFCEVKARKSARYGYGVESVTPQKITQIVRTADWYIKSKRLFSVPVRFDIASVDLTGEEVEYIPNAFTRNDAGRRNRW